MPGDTLEQDEALVGRTVWRGREAVLPGLTVEQKRARARGVKGVNYDARIDRFVSSITIAGQKRWLGSFLSVVGASAAYEAVRRENPVVHVVGARVDPRRRTVPKCYADFRESCSLDKYGHPAKGETFTTPDGQSFVVAGKYNYKAKSGGHNRAYCFLSWTSHCAVCGVEYETKTLARARTISSITRTCGAHRGQFVSRPQRRPEIEVLDDDGPVSAVDTAGDYACMALAPEPYDTEEEVLEAGMTHDDWRRVWYGPELMPPAGSEPQDGSDLI